MNINIRRVYLYLTSFIGLVLILIGSVQLVNLGLKTWVFTKADDQYLNCKYRYAEPVPLREGDEARELTDEEKTKQAMDCEEEKSARKQADAARSIAFILVGAPVWFYHWGKVKADKE
jgi:hypothetical protein